MEGFNVAIVGATGVVGQESIKILEQRDFPVASMRLLASDRSFGASLFFEHQGVEVEEALPGNFRGVDVALFFTGTNVSRQLTPLAVQEGAVVIDTTNLTVEQMVDQMAAEVERYIASGGHGQQ